MISPKNSLIALPNKKLRRASKKVELLDDIIFKIIDDMKAATLDWEDSRQHEVGVALSAVQIGKMYRIVIIRNDFEDKNNRNFTVFINPEVTKQEGKIVEDFEGCLSVPDIYGKVPRYEKVQIKATDEHGNKFSVQAEGFMARVIQHEIDHISGKVFIDHIKDKPDAFYCLAPDGKLKELDYDKVKTNPVLW